MLQKINLENILFLDIETVPEKESFQELDDAKKELWEQKSRYHGSLGIINIILL